MSGKSTFRRRLRKVANVVRLRGPLSADTTAQTLHGLNLCLVTMFTIGHFVTTVYPISIYRFGLFALVETGFITALILLRLGRLRGAGIVYMGGAWLYTTLVAAFHTGIYSPVLSLYVTIPISAAWLLGYRGALWTACVSLSGALVLAIFKIYGVEFPTYTRATPLGIWLFLVVSVLIGAVPVAHVLRTLQAALTQSRRDREELQEYKEHLEQLVTQRTGELREARDQALASNHAKSAFLAHMSHELRTPLNAILGFSDLLLQNAASDEERGDLHIINRSGEHLLGLINDVLDMAKIESGGTTVETVAVDLHGLLNDTVSMLRVRARAKNLGVLLEVFSATPRFVRCDAGKLKQVLTNLLGNAVKYTEEGGIVVRAGVRPGDTPNDFTLIFEVEDSGIGIALEDQARIFDPFVQAGGKRPAKGTGLGLAISRDFVRLLGGTIELESTPGRGSRFCVEIPAQAAEESEVRAETAGVLQVVGLEPGQPEYRVLIVEDQAENWQLLERLLRTVGFQVRVANDGCQGIEAFEMWRPHFIWMDIRLPVMSGSEAMTRIRELEGGAEAKIAAVTASAFTLQRDELINAGFDDFLRKPYRPQEVFDCMARHLGVRYQYATGRQPAAGDMAITLLQPSDLAMVPASVRNELKNAVLALNSEQIALLARQISGQHHVLGSALASLAGQLSFTPILKALESCDEALKASS